MTLLGKILVFISGWAWELIKRYYGACGLEKSIIRLIEGLPEYLSLKLGKNYEFWRRELEDPMSKIHTLNLLNGSIEFAVNMAKSLSEKTGVELCKYLRASIERNWIGNWLAGFIKGMLSTYYKLTGV
jgi:hypothetical protein